MKLVTREALENAIARCRERRPTVRPVRGSLTLFDVVCSEGHTHRVRFETFDSDLHADCFDPETGEECPSGLGRRLCYHVAAAVGVMDGLDEMRARNARAGRLHPADRDARAEHAAKSGGPLPAFRSEARIVGRAAIPAEGDPDAVLVALPPRKKPERVRGFQI